MTSHPKVLGTCGFSYTSEDEVTEEEAYSIEFSEEDDDSPPPATHYSAFTHTLIGSQGKINANPPQWLKEVFARWYGPLRSLERYTVRFFTT